MKITMTLLLLFFNAKAELLTLDDAIAMALQSHPDRQASALRHESSKADTKAAGAALYPRIDLNGEYYPTKTVVIPSNGILSTRQTDAFHADVSGSYPLWDFGRNGHIAQAAAYNEEGAASEKTSAENSIIEQVWLRYTTISYLEKLIDTAQKSSEFYEAQYTKAMKMREVGLKTHADESRFKASWLEADEHLSVARAEKEKALMALELLIGGDETVTIDEADFDRRVNAITATVNDIKIL
ncbi:MAG: TolC family protein, partial [Sulfuricurvum sp.]|nr:TolC family protein [Sulfuricurvum sp.]